MLRSRVFNFAVLGIGAIAFVFVIRALGWEGMRKAVGIGGWFAVIAVIDLGSAMCDAFAMHGFLRPGGAIPYLHVFAAQASGIAINRLTPANSLGEAVKVTMLVRHVSAPRAVATVVMFNLCTIFLGILAIAIGVPLTALMLDLPANVALPMWIGLGILVAFATTVAILVRRGAVGTLVDGLAGLRVISRERSARWHTKIAEIDTRLRSIGDAKRSGLHRGLAGVIGSRCFNWLGTLAVMYAADIPLSAPLVIASLSVGILVTWMSNIIPLGLGLADGTNYVLYGLLGASPAAGLLFTMVNRMRTVVLATIGLVIMAIANVLSRGRE